MTSNRLPGKSLVRIGEHTVLEAVVERVAQSREVGTVVVATSDQPSDEVIAEWCKDYGLLCIRGSLNDPTSRVLTASSRLGVSHFVRISADSPFIDPRLIDHAVRLFRHRDADLVTNTFPRSFPKGQSVEVLAVQALQRATEAGLSKEQREHVTQVFYENPRAFRILNFSTSDVNGGKGTSRDFSSVQLSIDTADDLEVARLMYNQVGDNFSQSRWQDLVPVWQEIIAEQFA